MQKIKVWDGFIRFFHWTLVVAIAGMYYTGEEELMEWHFFIGYIVMALVATRLLWGLIGSDNARLSSLLHSPKAAINSLRQFGGWQNTGHNPASSYMVLVFFVLLIIQLFSGLMNSDDMMNEGPLAQYISSGWADIIEELHELNFALLLTAIVVHIGAAIVYRIKGKNLVKPMITGYSDEPLRPLGGLKSGWIGFMLFAIIVAAVLLTLGRDVITML